MAQGNGMSGDSVSQPASDSLASGAAPPLIPPEELRLVEGLRRRDESAFMELVGSYHSPMLRLARVYVRSHQVAEEVVQETWLGVLKGIDRFEGRSSLKTWIFRILTNRAKTHGEREGRLVPFSQLVQSGLEGDEPAMDADRFLPADHPQWPHHWARPPKSWGENPEERLLAEEVRKCILDFIDSLPEAQRAVITLRDLQGLDASEVCNILDISETNQRVLLHRARAKVRAMCEKLLGAA